MKINSRKNIDTVQKAIEVSDLYMDAINAKLKILDTI